MSIIKIHSNIVKIIHQNDKIIRFKVKLSSLQIRVKVVRIDHIIVKYNLVQKYSVLVLIRMIKINL